MIGSKAILERRRASINLSRAVSVSFPVGYTYEQCSLPSRDFDSFSSVLSRVCVCEREGVIETRNISPFLSRRIFDSRDNYEYLESTRVWR